MLMLEWITSWGGKRLGLFGGDGHVVECVPLQRYHCESIDVLLFIICISLIYVI